MSQLKPLVVGADGRPARIQSGDVLDPAYLATGTRDGTRFLRDDGTYASLNLLTGGQVHAFKATKTATQVMNSNTWEKVTFGGKALDTDNCFSTINSRFQPTTPGYYHISGIFALTNATAHTRVASSLYVNGVWTTGGELISYASEFGYRYSTVEDTIYLNGTTDYVELWGDTSAGATVGYNSRFSGYLISAVGSQAPIAAKAYRATSAQSLTSGQWGKVSLNATSFDATNAFDTSTNFRFQPKVAGYYQISAALYYTASSGMTYAHIGLRKNGTEFAVNILGSVSGTAGSSNVSDTIYLNGTTDYVELWATCDGVSPQVVAGSQVSFLSAVLTGTTQALESVTCTVSGAVAMPYDGTVRRYFRTARSFFALTVGVTTAPASDMTVTIKKNGTSAATLQLISNNNYATGAISFSVAPGDYITAHMSGGDTSDAVITLE